MAQRSHRISIDDMHKLIDSAPEVIVAGTGVSGGMKSDRNLEKYLAKLGIEFIAAPNEKAMGIFNKLTQEKRSSACFHLTC